jgi:hypothetical protein
MFKASRINIDTFLSILIAFLFLILFSNQSMRQIQVDFWQNNPDLNPANGHINKTSFR